MTGLNDNLDDVVNMRKVARTCSIPQVAEAAVISIGGELARLTSLKAAWSGMSRGAYVADMVLAFQRRADLRAWARAEQETRGMDQPILAGLRHLLEKRFVSEAVFPGTTLAGDR
jgi:hypothetical protein